MVCNGINMSMIGLWDFSIILVSMKSLTEKIPFTQSFPVSVLTLGALVVSYDIDIIVI